MSQKRFAALLIALMLLTLGALSAYPALAEEATPLRILLNGQPVTHAVLDLNRGNTLQLDATLPASWSSSKSYRATVDQTGLVTCLSPSTVVITARSANGQKATCEVRMTRLASSITITGPDALAAGKSGKLKASVLPANTSNKKVSWSSSDPSVVSVTSSGSINAKKVSQVRSAVITAAAQDGSGVKATHTVTVRPAVQQIKLYRDDQPIEKEIYIDLTSNAVAQLSAQVLPADANQAVTWKTSSSRTVSVNGNGRIQGFKTGTATITAAAQDGSGKKVSVKVHVVRMVTGLTVSGNATVAGGKTVKLKANITPTNATQKKVTWESSNPSVAKVDKNGKVTAQKVSSRQQVTITARASDGSARSGSLTLTVVPVTASIQITQNNSPVSGTLMMDLTAQNALQLGARVEPADAQQGVTWSVSSSSKARVTSAGLVTGLKTGTITVTAKATDGSGKKASIKLSIVRAVSSIQITGNTTLGGGQKGKLKATISPANASNKSVTWTSSDPSVVTVDRSGSLRAAQVSATRQAIITATAKDGSGVTAQALITVTPRVARITLKLDGKDAPSKLGIDLGGVRTLRLSAFVEPADAMQAVRWTTSSSQRATVDANGLITAVGKGKVTITATAQDGSGKKASCSIEVGAMVHGVTISGAQDVASGRTITLKASVSPSNANNKKVSWSSSNESIARVSSKGVVTGGVVDVATQVTITATAQDGGGALGSYTITVHPMVRGISISRSDAKMGRALLLNSGAKARLSASITPAAAAQQVKWKSSNTSVAQIDANGYVIAGQAGTALITATASDGSRVSASLWVGVGNLSERPYYFEVDRANQVVRVYERGADSTYTHLIKRMICSTGRNAAYPDNKLYAMHGGRMVWMDGVAIYATRVNGPFLFHSVTYKARRMNALDATQYKKLGSPASAGCFRLLAGDAKWIYDNVPKGCFVNVMVGVRDASEYGAVSKPPLKSGNWDPTNPQPDNPDFDPTYSSDVK